MASKIQQFQAAFQENAGAIQSKSMEISMWLFAVSYLTSLILTGTTISKMKDPNSAKGWYGISMAAFIVGLLAAILWMVYKYKENDIDANDTAEKLYTAAKGFSVLSLILFFVATAVMINTANNVDKIVHVDDKKLIQDLKNYAIVNIIILCIAIVVGIVSFIASRTATSASATSTQFYYF